MQFFDGLRSGQDRSLQISRQRCGGYNKVGGNKKSHHGRWWDNNLQKKQLAQTTVHNARVSNSRFCSGFDFVHKALRRGIILVNAAVCTIAKLNFSHSTLRNIPRSVFQHINLCSPVAASLGKFHNISDGGGSNLRRISCIGSNFALTIRLRYTGLSRNNNLAAFSRNLILVGLVNVAGQRGDEQGGQDGRMTRTTISSTRVKPFLSFSFLNILFSSSFCLCADTSRLIGISYRHFITQFVFCQAKTCCKNPFCVFLLFSSLEFIGNRALFMNFNERLRYLIDCEEIKLKDLAPKLCLSASTLSNYAQASVSRTMTRCGGSRIILA